MEDILQKVEKTTDRELFGMQRYARYSAYQALLEISPKGSFPIEGCMAKAVIYILQWIKAKLSGNDEIDRDKEFEALPTAKDWEKLGKLEESPWSDKKFKEPIKLKLKYWDNCWALRFTEINKNFDGEFENDISLTREDNSVILAISTECRQAVGALDRAKAIRPGYVSRLIFDEDLIVTEKITLPDEGDNFKLPLCKEAFPVNGKGNEAVSLDKLIFNPSRNMPLIIVPEPQDEEDRKKLELFFDDRKEESDINHHGILGHYLLVYISGKYTKFIYGRKEEKHENIRQWIGDVLNSQRFIMIGPYREGEGQGFRYYVFNNEGSGYYTRWEESAGIETCPLFDEESVRKYQGLKLSLEPEERECQFGNYRFFQKLWNDYITAEMTEAIKNKTAEEIASEYREALSNNESEKDKWKEKYDTEKDKNEKLSDDKGRLENERDNLKREKSDLETENAALKKANKELEEEVKKLPTSKKYEERLKMLLEREKAKEGFAKKENNKELFKIPSEWSGLTKVIREELLRRILAKFKSFMDSRKKELIVRREDIFGIVYKYNVELEGDDALLYFPESAQLYENEFRNIILHYLCEEDKDTLWKSLAENSEFDDRWREKKRISLLGKINGFKSIDSIKDVLYENGIRNLSHNDHTKWGLYDCPYYYVTIACTPSVSGAGEAVVRDLMDHFF